MEFTSSVINMAISFSGMLLCVLGAVMLAAEKHIERRTFRFFRLVLLLLFGYILVNLIGERIGGMPGKGLHLLFRCTVFLEFAIGYLLVLIESVYLFSEVFPAGQYLLLRRFLMWYFLFELALLVYSQFSGLFYTIGPDNLYRRSEDTYWVTAVLSLLVLMINAFTYFTNLKKMNLNLRIAFGFYLFVPLVGMVVQIFVSALNIPIALAIICALIMFIYVLRDQTEKVIRQEKENAEMRNALMLSQIQPHFIFNSLGAIRELCRLDPLKAEEAVVCFSQYLRGNMESLRAVTPITFSTELGHTRNYLTLEKLRFGDMLRVAYDIRAEDFCLPALSLQPIVENAVRHGVRKCEDGGTVRIRSFSGEEAYVVEVEDDGPGFDPAVMPADGKSHVGIQNVRSRLEQMSGGRLEISSAPGRGTLARIIIPKK